MLLIYVICEILRVGALYSINHPDAKGNLPDNQNRNYPVKQDRDFTIAAHAYIFSNSVSMMISTSSPIFGTNASKPHILLFMTALAENPSADFPE